MIDRRLRIACALLLCVACRDDVAAEGSSDTDTQTSSTSVAETSGESSGDPGTTTGEMEEEGSVVEILFDHRGVPHVYGQTDEDAMFGAGYVLARDRLYQMEMLKRLLTGRLSEVLGQWALQQDQALRIFDVPRWGAADAEVMREEDPELAALISAWVAGINQRIDEIEAGHVEMPWGFRETEHDFMPARWTEDDPYIVLKGAELGLGRTVEFEIALTLLSALYPEPVNAVQVFRPAHPVFGLPPEDRPGGEQQNAGPGPSTAPPSPPAPIDPALADETWAAAQQFIDAMPGFAASNNWALDGRHTENGRPLIAGDPHIDFALMGGMYPMHINSADAGGTLDVNGFAIPGVPGINLGHTAKVAWTQTTAFGDVMDVWQVNPQGNMVAMGDSMVPITNREEVFTVRSATDEVGEGSTVTVLYRDVEGWGTILPDEALPLPIGGPYLVGWMGFKPQTTRWPLILNKMQSLDDFDEALTLMPELNQSCLAADADGIAYGISLDIPLRDDVSGARSPVLAMQGNDEGSLWTGEIVPKELMPYSRAPERGFIVTANNDPLGFTENGVIDDDPFYYGAFFAPGYRAKRIEDELLRLTERGDVTLQEMQDLQMDVHSTMADDLLPLLSEAWDNAQTDESLADFRDNADLAELVAVFEGWNRRMARNSGPALPFHAFVHWAMEAVIADDIGAGYEFAVSLQTVFMMKIADNALRGVYPEGDIVLQEGRDRILLTAAATTAQWLVDTFGGVDPSGYAFKDRKVTDFDDALGYGMPVFEKPTDGGEDTICVAENITFAPNSDTWASTWVSAERTVFTFDEDGTPQAWVNYPTGPAADPESSRTRQASYNYIEGVYERMLFRRDEVEENLSGRLRIVRDPS